MDTPNDHKHIDRSPLFLAVELKRQLVPGTFGHDSIICLTTKSILFALDARFKNEETGASAYLLAMLLAVILFAFSQGIVRRRGIEQACRERVTFIALCGDRAPHFTTLVGSLAHSGLRWRASSGRCSSSVIGKA